MILKLSVSGEYPLNELVIQYISNILKGNLLEVVFSLALSSFKRKASDARVKTKL